MLSISEFSEMCQLSPRTLRFYHAEGLLVPADVDSQNGYRSHTFDQVERSMLITLLRNTGMSVELVRQALDEPDTAFELLRQHDGAVQRQRQAQDEAIGDAHEFLQSWPEVRRRHIPEMTVVTRLVPSPSGIADQHYWDETDALVGAAVRELMQILESRGDVVSGTPWRTFAREIPEQQRRLMSADGPHWLVHIPVTAGLAEGRIADRRSAPALPGDIETHLFEARDELSIFMPGKSSMAKYATALSRLFGHPLQDAYVDVSRMRHVLHDDGIETTAALCRLGQPGDEQ